MSKCENSGCKMPCEVMPPCAKSEARLRKWLRNIGALARDVCGGTPTARQMPRGCRSCWAMQSILKAVDEALRGDNPGRRLEP
jgi:hypothetical protein